MSSNSLFGTVFAGAALGASCVLAALPITDGLVWHFDAAALSGLADGAEMETWPDLSGNGYDMVRKADTGAPSFTATGMNGYPGVYFDGTDYMYSSYSLSNPNTIFTVSRMTGAQNGRLIASDSDNYLLGYHGGYWECMHADGWIADYSHCGNLWNQVPPDPQMYVATASGSFVNFWNKGVLIAGNSNGNGKIGRLSLGGWGGGGELSAGVVSEVIVYSRVLDEGELQAVGSYLQSKWHIDASYAPFVAVNPFSGEPKYFASGAFKLSAFPELDNGTQYQFTLSSDPASLSASRWSIYDSANPPTTSSFPEPSADGAADLVLWTRANAAAEPATDGYAQPIVFASTPPTVVARDVTLMLEVGGSREILADEIDAGSSDPRGFASRTVSPSTITGVGTTQVTLTVVNTVGVSATATATVTTIPFVQTEVGVASADSAPVPQGPFTRLLHLGANFDEDYINVAISGAGGIDDDQLAAFGGQAHQRPYDGLEYAGIVGATTTDGKLVWTGVDCKSADGQWIPNPNKENYIKYWQVYIVNPDPTSRAARFGFKHDDDLRVWQDGTLVYSRNYSGADEFTQDVTLASGVNAFTFKLHEGGSGDYFWVRLTNPGGAYFTDLVYMLSPVSYGVADPVTGSHEFTSSKTVKITGLPFATVGTEYQFTLSADPASLSAGGWSFLDRLNPPSETTLAFGAAERKYDVVFWTRSQENGVFTTNSATCSIFYTLAPPAVRAHDAQISIDSESGTTLDPAWFDAGSSDAVSGIDHLEVSPTVVYAPGVVTFTAVNKAGLSASTNVNVVAGSWTDAHVAENGSDVTGTGRPDAPWRSITHAIEILGDTDITLYVHPGLYSAESGESFPIIPGNLEISGTGDDPSEVVVSGAVDVAEVFLYDGTEGALDAVSISGLTVRGGYVGMLATNCTDCSAVEIEGCIFEGSAAHGAVIEGADGATVKDSVFRCNGDNGIWIKNAPNTVFLDSVFRENASCGIELGYANGYNCDGTTFTGCSFIANGGDGIGNSAGNSRGLAINRCSFIANGSYGFGEWHNGYWLRDLDVRSSLFAFNGNPGIYISHGSAFVRDSHFYGNFASAASKFNGAFVDPNGGQPSLSANVSGNTFDVDPLLADWNARDDGAVYVGSPVIGAGTSGANQGCYQGGGLAIPNPVTYFVRPDGDDSHDGLADTPAGAFASLAPLADIALNPGDTIRVAAGVYDTPATLTAVGTPSAPIVIEGAEGATLSATAGAAALTLKKCANLVLSGFVFEGGDGLVANSCDTCTVTNCIFASCGSSAYPTLVTSPSMAFQECVFTNSPAHGLWFYSCNGLHLESCVFANNAVCGFNCGRGNGDQYTSPGLRASYCYIADNGALGIGMSTGHLSDWLIDHCTILGNASYGMSSYDTGYWPEGPTVTNSIIANNGNVGFYIMHGQMYTAKTLYWQNSNGAVGDCNGGGPTAQADLGGCVYDQDPLLCPRASRFDGAVFVGSPVLRAADDGSNFGCYQGPGVPPPAAAVYYVRPNGSDENDGFENTDARAFATIARGCRALANAGDTLCVAAGTYTDAATISGLVGSSIKPIRVTAEEGAVLSVADAEAALSIVSSDRIVIDGLTVADGAGIVMSNCSGNTFTNCVVANCAGHGLKMTTCPSTVIADSAFRGNAGHGLWFITSADVTLLRDSFVDNTLCGANAGFGNGDQYTSLGLRASYCFFGRNGKDGLGMSVGHLSNWIADHCTFVRNGSWGYGNYDTGYWAEDPVATNCLFAYNVGGLVMFHGNMYSDTSMYWGDASFAITDCNGGTVAGPANRNANVFDVDPLLCDWTHRDDGALYVGSPAIGALPDGSSYGCYQGDGEPYPAATTYFVSPSGSDANDGLSADTPFATISNACARALGPGDTIRVALGDYSGDATLTDVVGASARPVRIIAEPGTTLRAETLYGMHLVRCAYVEVSGIEFTGATADWTGAGVFVDTSYRCRFVNCEANDNWFGFYAGNGFETFWAYGNTFENCSASANRQYGFVCSAGADTVFDRCTATGNGTAGFYSNGFSYTGATGEKGATLYHCIAADNTRNGVFADNFGDLRLENCLVIRNGVDTIDNLRGGVVYTDNTHDGFGNTLCNSIVAYNGGCGVRVTGNTYYELHNDCVYGTVAGNDFVNILEARTDGCISADPLFRDYANGDYRLNGSSPCVDAGLNRAWMDGAKDCGGRNDRIVNHTVDIGLYEIFVGGTLIMVK